MRGPFRAHKEGSLSEKVAFMLKHGKGITSLPQTESSQIKRPQVGMHLITSQNWKATVSMNTG